MELNSQDNLPTLTRIIIDIANNYDFNRPQPPPIIDEHDTTPQWIINFLSSYDDISTSSVSTLESPNSEAAEEILQEIPEGELPILTIEDVQDETDKEESTNSTQVSPSVESIEASMESQENNENLGSGEYWINRVDTPVEYIQEKLSRMFVRPEATIQTFIAEFPLPKIFLRKNKNGIRIWLK